MQVDKESWGLLGTDIPLTNGFSKILHGSATAGVDRTGHEAYMLVSLKLMVLVVRAIVGIMIPRMTVTEILQSNPPRPKSCWLH